MPVAFAEFGVVPHHGDDVDGLEPLAQEAEEFEADGHELAAAPAGRRGRAALLLAP